jgi:hypothetical protein
VSASAKPDGRVFIRGDSRTLTLVALATGSLALLAFAARDLNALCLLPVLALALPLLMRRFPGERMLARRAGARELLRPRPRSISAYTGRALTVAPHGGLLIGCALAVRPPPALSAAS